MNKQTAQSLRIRTTCLNHIYRYGKYIIDYGNLKYDLILPERLRDDEELTKLIMSRERWCA